MHPQHHRSATNSTQIAGTGSIAGIAGIAGTGGSHTLAGAAATSSRTSRLDGRHDVDRATNRCRLTPGSGDPIGETGFLTRVAFNRGKLAEETPKTVEEIMAKATELLNELVGNALLVGFKNQLDDAIGIVNSLHGAPKLNYRCVRHLALVCELTDKVVKLMEQSSSF